MLVNESNKMPPIILNTLHLSKASFKTFYVRWVKEDMT